MPRIRVELLLLLSFACGKPEQHQPSRSVDGSAADDPLVAPDAAQPSADASPGEPSGPTWDDPSRLVSGAVLPDFLIDDDDDWRSLIAAQWGLAPGAEAYLCARVTVPREVLLHEFSLLTSPGTHHALLLVEDAGAQPDGATECQVDRSGRQIFDSNSFTLGKPGHVILPEGIAMRVRAGQQLLFNLHLLNPGTERIRGTSGVRVRTLQPEQVTNIAETSLMGPRVLHIVPGSVTQQARCAWPSTATVFAVAPHMHELGSYMKIVARSAGQDTVLFDGLYDFDWQHVYVTDPLALKSGDEIRIECTYQNTTSAVVGFGEGVHDEMCFAAVSAFPALEGSPACSSE